MRNYLLLGLLLVAGSVRAEEAPARNPATLAKVGDLDPALVDRLKRWVESELALPLPLEESLSVDSAKLEDAAAVAAERLVPEDIGMVVLDARADASEPNGIYRPDARVVVINVTDMREGADDEKLARRLERQVIRGVGVLMGLTWSPNPDSAMASYSTLDELDQIGRNLDPPWLLKLQERARELGLTLDPDNPNNLIRE
jgi:hypothetical protein